MIRTNIRIEKYLNIRIFVTPCSVLHLVFIQGYPAKCSANACSDDCPVQEVAVWEEVSLLLDDQMCSLQHKTISVLREES